jgi:hypothetical protein
MQGRNILDVVVIIDEKVQELHYKKSMWLSVKIDFEKAYDKIK